MSPATQDFYTGSCNPSRKAKGARIPDSASGSLQPSHRTLPIQPKKAHSNTEPTSAVMSIAIEEPCQPAGATGEPVSPHQPAKRGRKPGTMSRAARETQRKLNHSIIEKARRTKINDALATLRELVPSKFPDNDTKEEGADEEDDDDEDGGEYEAGKSKSKQKKPGKKEEKEKEFKLEILVRTVTYMQHLVGRVKDLEVQVQTMNGSQASSSSSSTLKRKRDDSVDVVREDRDAPGRRVERSPPVDHQSNEHRPARPRLPSISSWLPKFNADQPSQPAYASPSLGRSPMTHGYLPSPPSSTQFTPMTPTGSTHLPSLSLGPTSIPASVSRSRSSSIATPEEESAASLLLNFRRGSSCSPAFLPTLGYGDITSPRFSVAGGSGGTEEPFELGPAAASTLPAPAKGTIRMAAQTPSSLLGLGGHGF